MKQNKTVFDVNIWISYFIKNKTEEIAGMVFNNNVLLFRTDEMTEELTDVLSRNKIKKYLLFPVEFYIDVYEGLTEYRRINLSFSQCQDPEDNYLFDLAYQAHAEYLVSGDKRVLDTPVRKSLNLLTLTTFKKEIFLW
jgi:putative PIN family toxin of toxin-antitoxin system